MREELGLSIRIGIIGLGEVGTIFAADLSAGGAASVVAYDLVFDGAHGPARRRMAEAGNIVAANDLAGACRDADIVISAVTAAEAGAVADQAGRHLRPKQIYLDINSAAPSTKRGASTAVVESGASFVEGAVMAAVPGPRLGVPILGGGPDAGLAASLLNPLGMNITPVSDEIGRASAMKLCRSIMIKGLEALIIDCRAAAESWNVESEVYASLAATFPSVDWRQLSIDMPKRVRQHGRRRAAEMREAAQMLEEIGVEPLLSRAVADRHDAYAAGSDS